MTCPHAPEGGPLYRAATDPRLSPLQVRLLVALSAHLTPEEFRAVKLAWAAQLCRARRRSTAAGVLRALVSAGYLERGPMECLVGGQCYVTYRLARPPASDPVPL